MSDKKTLQQKKQEDRAKALRENLRKRKAVGKDSTKNKTVSVKVEDNDEPASR